MLAKAGMRWRPKKMPRTEMEVLVWILVGALRSPMRAYEPRAQSAGDSMQY